MKRKMEISIETKELVSIKVRRSFNGFCEQCRTEVEMLPPAAAARLSELSEREIFRLIENGVIHFVEAEIVFVCRKSIELCAEIFESKRSGYE